jgi:PAS domain S-box-containing protein
MDAGILYSLALFAALPLGLLALAFLLLSHIIRRQVARRTEALRLETEINRQMADALRQSEVRYRLLFESMLDGFALHEMIFDEQGRPTDYRFLAVNPAFERMTGLKTAEVIGRTVLDIMPGTERHWIEIYGRVTLTGNPCRFENYSGELKKYFEVVAYRPAPGQFACVFMDITGRRVREAQLRQAEKLQAIGQLAGGVAHDFNNQLAGVLGFADLLVAELQDGRQRSYAEAIVRSAGRAATLIRQLLAFARKGKHLSVPVDLHKVIADVATLLTRSIDKRIVIRQRLDANPPVIIGDPPQLESALLNVAINARDAMPGGGELTFATEVLTLEAQHGAGSHDILAPGRYVQVSVSDNGEGMDEQTLAHLFEPFFTTKAQGTGMGMAAVYGTVKNHLGAVDVQSRPGQGTTVVIRLPLAEMDEQQTEADGAQEMVRGKGRILLVEDEDMVRDMTAGMLRSVGYKVAACGNGEEAVAYYRDAWKTIDLVMLDMVMPGMDGRETFLVLRKINPGVKALLCSGYGIDGQAQNVLDEGVMGFIQKPFTRAELSQKVAETLGHTPS